LPPDILPCSALPDGPLASIEPSFPVEPLSPEISPCSVLPKGPLSAIEPLFPAKPLSPEILPCSILMNGPLSPIDHLFPVEHFITLICIDGRSNGTNRTFISYSTFVI
jgi:hypothetical protein